MHCDNIGDCYNLVKQSSRCIITMAIIMFYGNLQREAKTATLYRYVNTTRNPGDPFTRTSELYRIINEFDIDIVPQLPLGQWSTIQNQILANINKLRQVNYQKLMLFEHDAIAKQKSKKVVASIPNLIDIIFEDKKYELSSIPISQMASLDAIRLRSTFMSKRKKKDRICKVKKSNNK